MRWLLGFVAARWVSLLTVLGLLVLLLVIPQDTCTASSSGACILADDPLPAKTGVGEQAKLRLGLIQATKVESAQRLATSDATLTSPGRFVLVSLTAVSSDKPRFLTALLRSGERTFTPVHRDVVLSRKLSPGIPEQAQLLFELPSDAVNDDLTIEVDLGSAGDIAEVHLGPLTTTDVVRPAKADR